MSKISRRFRSGRDNDLVQLTRRVLGGVKGNPGDFPNLPQPLSVLEQALEEFQVALDNAAGGDIILVSIKNDKRTILQALLSELADYIISVCKGDRSKLLKSGFEVLRGKGEVCLQPITDLVVEIGIPGQAITRVKRVIAARGYIHQYTTDPTMSESSWVSQGSVGREYAFNNLQPGVRHWFRVIAFGFGDQLVYSPVVARYIQ